MDETDERNGNDNPELESGALTQTVHLSDMYQNWFLDYASYVILERAVPEITDGMKPVQRRILHAMKELDDGRFNKVANIIGHTMKYHPHGDASIGDALVQLGQKDLLVETQGNWGNILTGDSAAAPRYIEARPSKFALEVLFNPKTTVWQSSYDGRNKEPVALPAKFPLLLAQGVEGIAVGLASKILPHNFNELIDASIKILQEQEFEIYPDFLTGGLVDVSRYNDGLRGGKIRQRARINVEDKKTLAIREIPYGTTTSSIIDSILAANDKGKIKIRKIDDNTAKDVEILIHLSPGVSPDTTMDALYAFTECEVSISPNSCVIENGKPRFMGVSEILRFNTARTVELLRLELEIRRQELLEQLHYSTLEKIFIENEVYEGIKKCKTSDDIDAAIFRGLKPFLKQLLRGVTVEDVHKLRKIPIERISRYNAAKADEWMKGLQSEVDGVEHHLAHLIEYAVDYFRQIRKKYGKNRDRRSEIRSFDTIEAVKVAAANQKLYVNREEGFAGTGLKKDEYVCDCSDLDEIIVFRDDGTFIVTKIAEKQFVGKTIIHIAVFKKNDNRTVYNLIYRDGKNGKIMIKRFSVLGVNRDKEYAATKGTPGSKILYFTANPNGEAEVVRVDLKPKPRMKKPGFDFDFAEVAIRGRNSIGNILTRYAVKRIEKRQEGVSTLGSLNVWFDDTVQRLNTEGRGLLLGDFSGSDRIITFTQSGNYRLTSFDLSTHFEEDMFLIEKFIPETVYTVVYQDHETKHYYVKRFMAELTDRRIDFVEERDTLVLFSKDRLPKILLLFDMKVKTKGAEHEEIDVAEFIGVKGHKAKGKRLTTHALKKIDWLEPAGEVDRPEVGGPGDPVELKEGERKPDVPGMTESGEAVDLPEETATTFSGSARPQDAPFGLISVETGLEPRELPEEEAAGKGSPRDPDIQGMVKLEPEETKERRTGTKGRKKRVEPAAPEAEEEKGDTIQMELPL